MRKTKKQTTEDGKMKKAEGFYVYRWMIDDLQLRGIQLLAYAIIYAFSRNGKCFENGHGYLRAWLDAVLLP